VLKDLFDRMTTANMAVGYEEKLVRSRSHSDCHTFVCHIVKVVEVITAKRCPVREILRPRRGSLSAVQDTAVSSLSNRVESRLWPSCSTRLMPGVIGVTGVLNPEGVSRSLSGLLSDPVLGTSNNDPLPSVVSRDSASSSDSKKTRFKPVGLLLLAVAA
jgi:hypothetical protein